MALMSVATACASFGSKFDWKQIDELRPGMTLAEVHAKIGNPTSVTKGASGQRIETWTYSAATMFGATDARRVSLLFDADGKLVREVNRTDAKP